MTSRTSAQTDHLLEHTQRELGVRRWHLGFDAEVEARYESDTGAKRGRDLVIAGLIALLIYDLFLFNDRLTRPEVMPLALALRLGVMTPYGLTVLWLIGHGASARLREALMASTVTVAVVLSGAIFAASTSPHAMFDPFSFGLIFLAANVVYPLRFVHAVATSVVNLAIAMAFVVSYTRMPPEAKMFAFALMLGTAVFTLLANFRLEASERRSYLLLLRETLRSQAALHTNEALTVISNTDALTQLANRRWFDQVYASIWSDAAAQARAIAVLTIDVDHFKRYNDHFGHLDGDRCLRLIADTMRQQVRSADVIARLGGEEFIVVLRDADVEVATSAAERVRRAVEELAIPHDGRDGQRVVTVSIGVGMVTTSRGGSSLALLQRSDRALYLAKHGGRNQVHCMLDEPAAAA